MENVKDEKLLELLKYLLRHSFRDGLENILKARTGADCYRGFARNYESYRWWFFINKEYSPAHLYELAKMDGAIVLSRDLKNYYMQTHCLF